MNPFIAIAIGIVVAGAVAFLAFGALRSERAAQVPDRHKRTD